MSIDSSDGEVQYPFETEGDTEAIEWSSSNATIASIDQLGVVTVHRQGQVTITASSGEYSSNSTLMATYEKYTDYIRINTKAEFLMIFSNPDNFNSPDKKYVLNTDIDFNGDHIDPIGGWDVSNDEIPIDPDTQFRATLDGRGFALMNFTIDSPRSTRVDGRYYGVSLIPFMYDGVVRNLNIIDATFIGTGFTGSIAGKILYGVIENCFIKATITATAENMSIPAGGIAGIVGPDAIIQNVILDIKVNGGYIYSGFNFGIGRNSNAVSETLDDSERRHPIHSTALTTNNGSEEEDAALTGWPDSLRLETEQLPYMENYTFTEKAKQNYWTITDGYMPFLIRHDGLTPIWAKLDEGD